MQPDLVINIVDASNLSAISSDDATYRNGRSAARRSTWSMWAESKNMKVSVAEWRHNSAARCVPVIASTGKGVSELKTAIGKAAEAAAGESRGCLFGRTERCHRQAGGEH